MKIKDIKTMLSTIYEVNNVDSGYWYWFWKLYNIVIDMFNYDNLPEGISKETIENNLIMLGYCSFIRRKNGEMFNPFSRIFDFDENYQPIKMVFANPRITDYHTYRIGKDCEVVYNTSMKYRVWNLKVDGSLLTFLGRYARQLSDIEATANIYSVNCRTTGYPVADGEATANSIKAFFDKISIGERAVISDDSIINRFRNVDIHNPMIKDGINDWLIARDKILEAFFRDIGIKMNNPKKAQVNEEELTVNNQLLLISVEDMLKARKEGIEKVNKMFNLNIEVSLNEKFDVETFNSESVVIENV